MSLSQDHRMNVTAVDEDIIPYLQKIGRIFKIFDRQDSGCVSYGVEVDGEKWFVKYSGVENAIKNMKNAVAFNSAVTSPYLPELVNAFHTGSGFALVYRWVEGEVLHSPDFPGKEGRNSPLSPHYRFRQLPQQKILDALNIVYEVHTLIEEKGYIAIDFYDGCMIYDFEKDRLHFCDFDHYTGGPYILDRDRQYGSSRFMAPEEFVRGSRIDQRTNVYTMGAAAFVFLADTSKRREDWKASEELYRVAARACSANREERYGSIGEFYAAWRMAQGT